MFILDNVGIILVFALGLFVVFTFLNISTFAKDVLTTAYLTFIFFDLFFRMPFKAIQFMHKERQKIIEELEKDAKYNFKQKQKIQSMLQKRSRIFITLYKAGGFSYTNLMVNLTKWYKNKPFRVRIKFVKQNKKSYESKYINDMKKDISGIYHAF